MSEDSVLRCQTTRGVHFLLVQTTRSKLGSKFERPDKERYDVEIMVNGEHRQVAADCSVAALVEELKLLPKYLAVERNQQLVPRATHAACVLQPGDRIEIVTLVGGG